MKTIQYYFLAAAVAQNEIPIESPVESPIISSNWPSQVPSTFTIPSFAPSITRTLPPAIVASIPPICNANATTVWCFVFQSNDNNNNNECIATVGGQECNFCKPCYAQGQIGVTTNCSNIDDTFTYTTCELLADIDSIHTDVPTSNPTLEPTLSPTYNLTNIDPASPVCDAVNQTVYCVIMQNNNGNLGGNDQDSSCIMTVRGTECNSCQRCHVNGQIGIFSDCDNVQSDFTFNQSCHVILDPNQESLRTSITNSSSNNSNNNTTNRDPIVNVDAVTSGTRNSQWEVLGTLLLLGAVVVVFP